MSSVLQLSEPKSASDALSKARAEGGLEAERQLWSSMVYHDLVKDIQKPAQSRNWKLLLNRIREVRQTEDPWLLAEITKLLARSRVPPRIKSKARHEMLQMAEQLTAAPVPQVRPSNLAFEDQFARHVAAAVKEDVLAAIRDVFKASTLTCYEGYMCASVSGQEKRERLNDGRWGPVPPGSVLSIDIWFATVPPAECEAHELKITAGERREKVAFQLMAEGPGLPISPIQQMLEFGASVQLSETVSFRAQSPTSAGEYDIWFYALQGNRMVQSLRVRLFV